MSFFSLRVARCQIYMKNGSSVYMRPGQLVLQNIFFQQTGNLKDHNVVATLLC